MAKKPARPSKQPATARKGAKAQGLAADLSGAPAVPGSRLAVEAGPDGKVVVSVVAPTEPLPSVEETVDRLDAAIDAAKVAKAARGGAIPPVPEADDEEPGPKLGRPTRYTQELADDLLAWMADGKSVASWCREEGRPHVATVLRWTAAHLDFREAYARARELHADAIFDECVDIADNSADDWVETSRGRVFNGEAAARSRVRVETRMKVAARLNPRKYSEKLDLTIDDKRPATPEARLARIQELLALGVVGAPDAPSGV